MAKQNLTVPKELVINNDKTTLARPRHELAIVAACEIFELNKILRNASEGLDAVRGISIRIEQLSEIILSALSDSGHATQDLHYQLYLEKEEATA